MRSIVTTVIFFLVGLGAFAGGGGKKGGKHAVRPTDAASQLKLPTGFSAVTVVENFGKTRHIAVAPNGAIFVKLARLKDGKGIYRLEDTNGDGKADKISGFGTFPGTGMAIRDGYLYASSDEEVFRFKLDANNNVVDGDKPEKIVTGLLSRHEHEAKAITLDHSGNLFVNIGAYSNACQLADRQKGSPGQMPCPILDSAGGIWEFKADQPNQTYGTGARYATGLRNVVGFDWNTQTNSLFVMQHGRDQLSSLFPQYWNDKQSAELPAECMYELHKGSNCGWPYIFYDQIQHRQVLGPEYGGDGKKGPDKQYQDPIVAFPGHLAPNGLLFYTGNQFPEKYKNGAFVAFHGSWNRAPEPQAGYFVVFVPFNNGKPSGKWEVFADNFSGGPEKTASGRVDYRPCGLAQGPDGSMYVTDDTKGTIWKISYKK
ncbi:PQQ-dependent sugar dehydrogenase [Puia sp.]|jgi:glucose/arabinose dehydrogenase|uniref:PQQ-dependent sugar dehydrogenase n=1 Tax=Puia sp. TaxID=2045100 RepID=UPI002F406284